MTGTIWKMRWTGWNNWSSRKIKL